MKKTILILMILVFPFISKAGELEKFYRKNNKTGQTEAGIRDSQTLQIVVWPQHDRINKPNNGKTVAVDIVNDTPIFTTYEFKWDCDNQSWSYKKYRGVK